MSRYFKKSFTASAVVHGTVLILLILIPLIMNCRSKKKPHEIKMFVNLQAAPQEPLYHEVDEIEMPDEPEIVEPDIPEPEPPPVIKEPPQEPVPRPKPTARTKPTPRPKPTPKKIKVSRQRVRRDDDPPPKPKPRTQLSPDQIEKMLAEGIETSARGQVIDDGIPSWYYSLLTRTMYEKWQQPSGVSAGAGNVTRVTIRVLKNGTITRREITRSSGIPVMDDSVMRAVNSISSVKPLPASFNEDYKDIYIDFELTGAF
jgi:protein TonB